MNRHQAREKALQALFQIDMTKTSAEEAIEAVLEDKSPHSLLVELVNGVVQQQEAIDEFITKHLENWSLSRLARIDRNILRIAAYEMRFLDDIPVNVSIDEAIELAKTFGDDQSSRFVNGVLSKLKSGLEK
ncbi:transcription antitermination factor NusB [Bacillus sp. HMF5848]|uniref:transcription antitermination factor NusB n=1 Tax=Bacillus sp. HMF5848 TaxID=2495421 RepID=UPI000F79C2C9|nr:transcription antitermination factor NusB [Bacillus sp. HMF5848]RSK27795.1 transcription antitermination factor NusB [Bacillus sp. HMF5848]